MNRDGVFAAIFGGQSANPRYMHSAMWIGLFFAVIFLLLGVVAFVYLQKAN